MSDEAEVLQLLNELIQLAAANRVGTPEYRAKLDQAIELLYEPLKAAFEGKRRDLEQAGLQPTQVLHDYFVKLLRGATVPGKSSFETFLEVKKLIATVIQYQFRDALKLAAGKQRHHPFMAEAKLRERYFEERYQTKFLDFMALLDRWEAAGTVEQKLAAQVLRFRYVTGEPCAKIAEQFGITDRECKPQRELARREFAGK